MLPKLRPHIPEFTGKYIEPFAGSACLFFDLNPERAVLSDLNGELVETYQAIMRRPNVIAQKLATLPVGQEAYYEIRAWKATELSKDDRAARFIYLNRFCFNGLYRTNKAGEFNVPFGAPKNLNVPSREQIHACAVALRKAVVLNGDFESVVREHAGSGDFVYMDPPFFRTDRREFREYTASPFSADDLERLRELLGELQRRNCSFLLSYAYCKEAVKAFEGFKITSVLTRRSISGFPQHRRTVKEMIVASHSQEGKSTRR